MNHGAKPNTPINPMPNIVHAKDPKILVSAWPAIIFANNRIAKLNTRTKYEIISNNIKNHDIIKGAPDGKNKSTSLVLCKVKATIFNPINDAKLKQKVVKAKLVTVNVYGIIPNIFALKITKNKKVK